MCHPYTVMSIISFLEDHLIFNSEIAIPRPGILYILLGKVSWLERRRIMRVMKILKNKIVPADTVLTIYFGCVVETQ